MADKNDRNNDTEIPILIIQPKLITGNNPEKTKEEKPAIVVITV